MRCGDPFSMIGITTAARSKETLMKHMTQKLALLAGLSVAFAGVSYTPPATAQVAVGIEVGRAPPPPRYMRIPPPRVGYIWAPGYWRWDGRMRRHVWVGGYWVRGRPGYRYVPERWVHYGPNYRFERGHWAR
jgi:hypothetical protein